MVTNGSSASFQPKNPHILSLSLFFTRNMHTRTYTQWAPPPNTAAVTILDSLWGTGTITLPLTPTTIHGMSEMARVPHLQTFNRKEIKNVARVAANLYLGLTISKNHCNFTTGKYVWPNFKVITNRATLTHNNKAVYEHVYIHTHTKCRRNYAKWCPVPSGAAP